MKIICRLPLPAECSVLSSASVSSSGLILRSFDMGAFDRVCPVCGKTFEIKNIRQIYCSYKCGNKARYKPREKVLPQSHGTGNNTCLYCGAAFTATVYNKKFCCESCRRKFRYRENLEENRRKAREYYWNHKWR